MGEDEDEGAPHPQVPPRRHAPTPWADAAVPRAFAPRQAASDRLLLRVLAKVYYCQLNDVCLFEQVFLRAAVWLLPVA